MAKPARNDEGDDMKKSLMVSAILGVLASGVAVAADQSMASVLFGKVSGVSTEMQQAVVNQLTQKQWVVKENQLATAKCGAVPHKVEVVDLNKDGRNEVFLTIGNACTSGKIGSSLYLFIEDDKHQVSPSLGFSATGYDTHLRAGESWPDIVVKGAGACQPVWRYQAGKYRFAFLYESKPGACSTGMSSDHFLKN